MGPVFRRKTFEGDPKPLLGHPHEERRLRVTQSPFWVTLIYHKSHLSEDIFLPRSAGLIQFIVLQHLGIDIEDYFLGYVRQMVSGPLQFSEHSAKTET